MKYKEAVNGPNGEAWLEEVDNEHERMVKNQVLTHQDLPAQF